MNEEKDERELLENSADNKAKLFGEWKIKTINIIITKSIKIHNNKYRNSNNN